MLKYEKLVLGDLSTNCYIVWEPVSKETVIIDAADSGVDISEEIQRLGLKPTMVAATHGHFDHLLGALDLKLIFGIPLAVSSKDLFLLHRQKETAEHFLGYKIKSPNIMEQDVDLDKIESFKLGNEVIKVLKTPGHTPGGISFYSEENELLISGDILFEQGAIGSASHQYSNRKKLYESINFLLQLPKDTLILPGHGEELTIYQFEVEFGRSGN